GSGGVRGAGKVEERRGEAGIVSNALDLPRIGVGVRIEHVVALHEPDGCLDALTVPLEGFQRNVLLAAEACEFRIRHASTLPPLRAFVQARRAAAEGRADERALPAVHDSANARAGAGTAGDGQRRLAPRSM